MATLGPVVASVLSELEPAGDGNTHVQKHEENISVVDTSHKKSGSILHHFKLTETRIREGEYEEEIIDASTRNQAKKTVDNDDSSKSCGCFGRLFRRK